MSRSQAYDVWLVAANTVYKGVPYGVVSGWAGQGRIGANDKLRPAGSNEPWVLVSQVELIADYLAEEQSVSSGGGDLAESLEPVEIDPAWPKSIDDDDDDVDMIPLIDISLVLLIFFMMTAAVSAFSPVQVPALVSGTEMSESNDGMAVFIDQGPDKQPLYSLQVGNNKPEVDSSAPGDKEKLIAMLDSKLGQFERTPIVRIACHEALPRRYIGELCADLQKRVEDGRILRYIAEVNEKKK